MVRLTPEQIEKLKQMRRQRIQRQISRRETFTPRPLSTEERLKRLRIFSPQPKQSPPISRREAEEILSSERFDFLEEEPFMFSDDFIPNERFIPKRIRDL